MPVCERFQHLDSYTSGRYDLLHSYGRALRERHLSVGGLLWSSTERQLSPGAPGVTERTGRQRIAVPDDVIIQHRGHALADQKEPANTDR